MKAARLFAYDKPLKIVDVDVPRVKSSTEVLVRITGAGVCHTDLHVVEGVWREKVQRSLPYTLGHENAGLVKEIGDDVKAVKEGDRVILHPVIVDGLCRPCRIGDDMHCENLVFPGITADGGFAEYLVTSERSLVNIHDLKPEDVAPLADAGLTAIRAVKKAREGAELDGFRAHQLHLVLSEAERKLPPAVRARRDELEIEIARLRESKTQLGKDEYYPRLEALLLELARLYESGS